MVKKWTVNVLTEFEDKKVSNKYTRWVMMYEGDSVVRAFWVYIKYRLKRAKSIHVDWWNV